MPSGTQRSPSAMKGLISVNGSAAPLKQPAGKSIAEVSLEVGNRATALSGQDKSERAVEVVLEEYETLPVTKKLRLLQLLENNMKATVNRGSYSNTDGGIEGRIGSGFVKDIDGKE